MNWEPIRWQDVKGLPEGARVQNNKQAKVTSAFFPYYFWDPKTKGPKQERDYIGSVKDGVFVPDVFPSGFGSQSLTLEGSSAA